MQLSHENLDTKWDCNSLGITSLKRKREEKAERYLKVRSSELIGISHLTGKSVEYKPSAVSDHLLLHNHDSDFNDFTILCQENNGFRLLLKESVLISRDSPDLNNNFASIPSLLFH